jgi:hypothetical protein
MLNILSPATPPLENFQTGIVKNNRATANTFLIKTTGLIFRRQKKLHLVVFYSFKKSS